MKAMVRHRYGSPDVLHLEDVDTPTPGDGEVRVKVRAASLNLGDWELLTADPLYIAVMAKLMGPKPRVRPTNADASFWGRLFEPKYKILGCDIAGHIDAVGAGVTRFEPGDDVFGMCALGAFAEYVCVPEAAPIAPKPPSMTFEQAAALPQAAFIALQGIRDKAPVEPGTKVLITGAGGGAGTLAVQLAKARGAEVTGVDNGSKLELMRSLGADYVIDYTTQDFTQNGELYDLILDLVATRSVFKAMRSLSSSGTYVVAGGNARPTFQSMLLGGLISKLRNQTVAFLMADSTSDDLQNIAELYEAGTAAPVIDRTYPLSELPAAIQYMGEGRSLGKLIITM